MKKIAKISCKVPCNISINGEKCENTKYIDVMSDEDFYITFLPFDKNKYLAYSTSLSHATTSDEIDVVPFNTHTEICYNPTQLPLNQSFTQILGKKYGSFYFTINNSDKSFLNIDELKYSHKSTIPKLLYANFNIVGTVISIMGETETKLTYILLFNTKTKKVVLETLANSVEITKNTIRAIKFYPTITGYGKVFEFDNTTQKLNNYNVYKESKPHIVTTNELIPYAFLECLKYGDYNLAKHYLTDNLVSTEHLKKYFGMVREIYYNGFSENEINYTILSDTYHNYTFSISDFKISEIEENQLNNN